MSDWRQDNKDIINIFEENQLIYSLGAITYFYCKKKKRIDLWFNLKSKVFIYSFT
jgi:hypothetical protein